MPIHDLVIDERTRARGSEAQQADWEATGREVREAADRIIEYDASLEISVTEQSFLIRAVSPAQELLYERAVHHDTLAATVNEYVDIVRQIANAEGLNQMEALDMAKKVTHDRAARVLKKELRDFGFDHETCRKLFTFLLSLRVDTTRISGINSHRPMR
ncbi:MAG: UPF0262 family protein [Myxococcota bacterium]